jgi:hypothetical protein
MKSIKALPVLLCIILCMFCVQLAAQDVTKPDTIKLEYKFVKGDVTRYKVVLDMNADIKMDIATAQQIPQMALKIVAIANQKVNKVFENGDAEIIPGVESLKLTMMGATNEMPMNQAPQMKMVMSKTGSVKSITGIDKATADMLSSMPMIANGASMPQISEFPDKPIGVGDSWIQDIPNMLGGNMHYECKLGTYTVAVFSENVNGDMTLNMKPPTGATQSVLPFPQMGMSGKYDAKLVNKFSTDLGKLVSCNGTINMQFDMSMPNAQTAQTSPATPAQSIKVVINGTIQMYLAPAPVAIKKK